jgi:hypothetical protein
VKWLRLGYRNSKPDLAPVPVSMSTLPPDCKAISCQARGRLLSHNSLLMLRYVQAAAASVPQSCSQSAAFATGLCKAFVSADTSRLKKKNSEVRAPAYGRAAAQADSSRLPTAAARVRAQLSSCRICGQSDTGAGFRRVLSFPLKFIPPTARHSSYGAGTRDQTAADVPSDSVSPSPKKGTYFESTLKTADSPAG